MVVFVVILLDAHHPPERAIRALKGTLPEKAEGTEKRWARQYDACVRCGTTRSGHSGKGICDVCRQREIYLRRKGQAA